MRVDESEFRRRIAGYIERDLPDLASDRHRIAELLTEKLWWMVNGWFVRAEQRGQLLDWLDETLAAQCPDCTIISEFKISHSGANNGRLSTYGAQ